MNEDNHSKSEPFTGLILLLLAVLLVWAISGWALYSVPDRGTLGDMFGAINALFSGLAFASLVYTIFLQRRELALQRQELSLTRTELEGQKLQISAQNDVLRAQNFENTFFQLLKSLNEIVSAVDLRDSNYGVTKGRDCFRIFYRRLGRSYSVVEKDNPNADKRQLAVLAYERLYVEIQGEIGHYFRTLYNLVKFVHQSGAQDKRFYTNLIRAQLSSDELLMLFYNCASSYGREKFKPLIEEYALLKTLPVGHLLAPTDHSEMYASGAYGRG